MGVKAVLKRVSVVDAVALGARVRKELRFRVRDQQLVRAHLGGEGVKRLQIGGGDRTPAGWLNTDFDPPSPDIVFLDATKPFPFPSEQFDYVFSEHMIEHVDFEAGRRMVREIFRVLVPGGRLRIVTPDLQFLADLRRPVKSELQEQYVDWALRESVPDAPTRSDAFVINNYFRAWGHRFIYDEDVLRHVLAEAGFLDLVRHDIGMSDDPQLAGMEFETRMPPGFLRLESLVLEAVRPRLRT